MRRSMAALGSHDNTASVAENRARMATALGVKPHALLTAYQITFARRRDRRRTLDGRTRPRADAIVTRTPGLADGRDDGRLRPVLLADPVARVIGAAHAGWRGALTGIVEATVAAMKELGATPGADPSPPLGPMIRQQNYEVGSDLITRFTAEDPASERFFCAGVARRPRPVRSCRLYTWPALARRRSAGRGPRLVHLRRCRRNFSASAARPTEARATTAATSTQSRLAD